MNFFLIEIDTYQMIDFIIRDIYPMLDEGQIKIIRELSKTNKRLKATLTDDRIHSIQYMYSRIYSIIKHFKNEGIFIQYGEGLSMGVLEGPLFFHLVTKIGQQDD